ncbi:MAG: hypothetical protein P8X70_01940, partial [Nanoarchaeota archaeon]
KSDSDQYKTEIIYPDNQVNAQIYIAEESASITAGSSGSVSIGSVMYKDTETSSYNTKNVIVVGGSCINEAAASLVGGAYCTSDWVENTKSFTDDETGIGAGEFVIKGYETSDVTSKFALLVAGYGPTDTTNAVAYLINKKPDTSMTTVGTSSTTATLQTETSE